MYSGLLLLMAAGLFFGVGATVAIIFLAVFLPAVVLLYGAMRILEPEASFEKALAVGCMSVLLSVILSIIFLVFYVVAMNMDVSVNNLGELISSIGVWAYVPIPLLFGSIAYWVMHYVDPTFLRTVGIVCITFVFYAITALVAFFVIMFCVPDFDETYVWIKDAIVTEYTEKYGAPQVEDKPQEGTEALRQWYEQQQGIR